MLRVQLERQRAGFFQSLREYSALLQAGRAPAGRHGRPRHRHAPGADEPGVEIAAEVADSLERSVIADQVANGVSVPHGPAVSPARRPDGGFGNPRGCPDGSGDAIEQTLLKRVAGRPGLAHRHPADVLVDDGRVAEVGPGLDAGRAEVVIGATGWSSAPALVDLRAPAGAGPRGRRDHRDRVAGGRLGGYTAVCPMPNTDPVARQRRGGARWWPPGAARSASIDVFTGRGGDPRPARERRWPSWADHSPLGRRGGLLRPTARRARSAGLAAVRAQGTPGRSTP